jgi:lipoyl-dependent peroxiredoxin
MHDGDDDTGRDRLQATLEWNGDRGLTSPSAGRKRSSMAIKHHVGPGHSCGDIRIEKIVYTAEATTWGDRAGGHGRTSDGRLAVDLDIPVELQAPRGPGTNPERLFALGYGACFRSALLGVAAARKLDVADSRIRCRVSIGTAGAGGGFALAVALDLEAPHLSPGDASMLMTHARASCPYSRATRGNIEVSLTANGAPLAAVMT